MANHYQSQFNTIQLLISQQQYDDALTSIKALHIEVHDRPVLHFRVHQHWLLLAIKKQHKGMMLGQILPLIFAIPVSWFHHYAGLAVKSHKKD